MILRSSEVLRWIVAACFIGLLFATPGIANAQDATYGVLVQKPLIDLPQDQGKWYVSVVGDNANSQYGEIAGWFETDKNLKNFRYQTHYNKILIGTAAFKERYKPNIKGLPTVRVQDADGVTVYEAHGNTIPYSADGLYAAIAKAVDKSRGLLSRSAWPCPRPCPTPKPEPDVNPDPEPDPLSDGGPPEVTPPSVMDSISRAGVVVLLVVNFIVSFLIGIAASWYGQYNTMKRG